MAFGKWKQGFYNVINTQKYIGNNKPFFRSSWEERVCYYFDLNKNVLAWSSERFVIPYRIGNEVDRFGKPKIRRYFVDFYCEIKGNDGTTKKFLVEVKPKSQSVLPEIPTNPRKSKSYKTKAITFAINKCKWDAAEQYCNKKGFQFKILTEEDIYSMKV